MSKTIAVIGNSHVRTFADNPSFFPLFLGPGKEICFIDNAKSANIYNKLRNIIPQLSNISKFIFVFGEPECRWSIGQGWYPWKSDKKAKVNEQELNDFIDLYKLCISSLLHNKVLSNEDFIVYNSTYSDISEQNIAADIWNEKINEFCIYNKIRFLNVNKLIKSIDYKVHLADPVHFKTSIMPFISREIESKGIKLTSQNNTINSSHNENKKRFGFNTKFNCFTLKDHVL